MYNVRKVFSHDRKQYGASIHLDPGSIRLFRMRPDGLVTLYTPNQMVDVRVTETDPFPNTMKVVTILPGYGLTTRHYPIEPANWPELLSMIPVLWKTLDGAPAVDWLKERAPYPFAEVLDAPGLWRPDPARLVALPDLSPLDLG